MGLEGGVNLYAYVDNNPLRFIDPFGLTPAGAAIGRWLGGIAGEGADPLGGGIPGAAIGAFIGAVVGDALSGAMEARSHGDGGEARPADVNPGRDCNGKCNPCPPNPPPFDHPGDAHGTDRGSHTHQWQYHQAPDCMCRAQKKSW